MGTPVRTHLVPLDRKWPFRLAALAWVAVGVGRWFLADGMGRPGQVLLAGLWLVGLGLLLRHVPRCRCSGRCWPTTASGSAAAVADLGPASPTRSFSRFVFTWVYFTWYSIARYGGSGSLSRRTWPSWRRSFFATYMVIQFILVCLLTPASVAGAHRRREGTADARIPARHRPARPRDPVRQTGLAGRQPAPVPAGRAADPSALIQFFGGIDPDLVIAGFAATIIDGADPGGCRYRGVRASRGKPATPSRLTYLAAVAYVRPVGLFVGRHPRSRASRRNGSRSSGTRSQPEDVDYPFVAGNPFVMVPSRPRHAQAARASTCSPRSDTSRCST